MEFQLKALISNWKWVVMAGCLRRRTSCAPNVYGLYVGSGIWRKSFYAFLRAHSVKVIKCLPKHRTTDSVSQTRLKQTRYICSSSLHDLPTKIDLPIKHHKTIILSCPFHVREQCRNYVLKQTVQKLIKSLKGSRFNHANSDQIRWLPITSCDAPQISVRIHPLSHTTSPRRSASLHPPNLHSIVANLVVVEAKLCDGFVNAQGIGQGLEEMESRASIRWLMDDSWQNSKSQTSSNFWCLDISQVTWTKIIESLPKQRTKDSDSQGTLSKTNLSSLHDLPTKIALPTKLSPNTYAWISHSKLPAHWP